MDKSVIFQYVDAKELEKETEQDLNDLRSKATVRDKVTGSNPEFPYNKQSFSISGIDEESLDKNREKILEEKLRKARKTRIEAEKVFNAAPLRMQRIIRLRIIYKLPWSMVAARMGGKATENGIRMEFNRWLKET